jgi:AraC-like DNA-binding protein
VLALLVGKLNRSEFKGLGEMAIRHWAQELAPRVGVLEKDTVSANFIDRLIRGAINMGASRPRLLSAIHVGDASLRNPVGRVARLVLVHLFEAIERELGDRSAGMQLASAARPQCFSDLGYIALFAPTVGDMVATTIDIQHFRQNVWETRFDRETDPARIVWTLPADNIHNLDAAIEFSLASYAHLYRHSLPSGLAPVATQFRHQPRFDGAHYERLLGCPVTFGAEQTAILFDANMLKIASPLANSVLQQHLLAVYQQPVAWLAEGRQHSALSYLYLASELNKSPLTLDRVAASFGLTERTLRRKLVQEEFPFRDLLEKVRRDLCAIYALEARRNLGEVAELLGYAELSAFTRAYRRWHGKPPSAQWKSGA